MVVNDTGREEHASSRRQQANWMPNALLVPGLQQAETTTDPARPGRRDQSKSGAPVEGRRVTISTTTYTMRTPRTTARIVPATTPASRLVSVSSRTNPDPRAVVVKG
jgi:hypothetical protein